MVSLRTRTVPEDEAFEPVHGDSTQTPLERESFESNYLRFLWVPS